MLMPKCARISFLLLVLASWAFAGEEYLIRASSANIGSIAARHGLKVLRSFQGSGGSLHQIVVERGGDINALAADREVEGVEVDGLAMLPEAGPGAQRLASVAALAGLATPAVGYLLDVRTLALYVNQPAVSTVWLPGARSFATGSGVVVAILDTGADLNHPMLKNSMVPGFDFTRNAAGGSEMPDLDQSTSTILDSMQSTSTILDGMQSTSTILDKSQFLVLNQSTTAILDQSTSTILDHANLPGAFGHGTMVAGIIHLVAPNAKIMPVKVFDGNGVTSMARIVAGIYWAVDHGANAINMSFSSTDRSKELQKAIDYAVSKGVICVASAGNEGKDLKVFPAGYGVIGVGSTNNQMVRSSFSNYGNDLVDLAAPGEGVITLYPGGNYAAAWGTSFSAPFVTGGAALLASIKSTDQSRAQQSLDRALPIGQLLGAGELNLSAACLYRATQRH